MDYQPSCLIVDDEKDILESLSYFFQETRFDCKTALNGREALEKILECPPDILLTDLMMPEMNGIDLIKKVRELPQTEKIPIVILSANLGEFSSDLALFEGLEIVEKPITDEKILTVVNKILPPAEHSQNQESLNQKQLFELATQDLVTSLAILNKQEPELSEKLEIQAPRTIQESIIFTHTFNYDHSKFRLHFAFTHEWARMATGALLDQATVRDVNDDRVLEVMSKLNQTIANKMIHSFSKSGKSSQILSSSLFYNLKQQINIEVHQKVTIYQAQFTTLFGYVNFYLYPLNESL